MIINFFSNINDLQKNYLQNLGYTVLQNMHLLCCLLYRSLQMVVSSIQ